MPLHRRKASPEGAGRQDAALAGQRQGRRMRRWVRTKKAAGYGADAFKRSRIHLFVRRLVVEQGARRTRALLVIGWYPGILPFVLDSSAAIGVLCYLFYYP
jgi:hypothetical protein